MELLSFPGEIHVVDGDKEELSKAVEYLGSQKMLGFDTETRPVFSPGEHSNGVSLLQLSGKDKAYLFRINKIGLPKEVCEILSDINILKIGAASHDDVRSLRKVANFEGRGFVDLQRIAWEWGINDKSVKKLAANILGKKVSKTQQLSNWEAQTLSPSQMMYGATDAWVCLVMYEKLLASPKNPNVESIENVQNYIKEG